MSFFNKKNNTLAKEKANSLVKDYSTPPIPVLEIAESHGVDVVFSEMGDFADTVSGFCDFPNKKLYVNSGDHVNKQMFTMAHELGHWLLHRSHFEADPETYAVLPRFRNADNSSPLEQEANAFAANLLVPTHLLEPVKSYSAAELAGIFSVSRIMMEIRLKDV